MSIDIVYIDASGKEHPSGKKLLFNGNVFQPVEILIALLLLPLFVTGIALFFTFSGLKDLRLPEEFIQDRIVVLSIAEEEEYLYLKTAEGELRTQENLVDNLPSLRAALENGEALLAEYEPTEENGEHAGILWSLKSADGTEYVQREQVLRSMRQGYFELILFFWLMSAAVWLLFAGTCYILDHAPEHPILASVLLKKNARNY